MPTATAGYFVNGVKVPSVTQIIRRFGESGGLMQWAFAEGKRAISDGQPNRGLYDEKRAADIGTLAHAMVESWIHGRMGVIARPESMSAGDYAKAEAAFQAYLSWERQSRLRILETEVSLVSEKHCFGGTLDAIGEIDGELCLPDWKTGSTYTDHLVQLGGYGILAEEVRQIKLTGGYHLVRFSREGDFHHHHFPELAEARAQFLDFLRCFDRDKALKKRLG